MKTMPLTSSKSTFVEFIRLLRPLQWLKNSFVFVGLVFAHAWHSPTLVMQVIIAAIAFCFIASSVYIFNDLRDRDYDRQHLKKCQRPLATGNVSATQAIILMLVLLIAGLALASTLSWLALIIISIYVLLNFGYSLGLKDIVILDVFIIAAGYLLRILIGTIGVGIPATNWLLLCSMMLALFLGFGKRRAELMLLSKQQHAPRSVIHEYNTTMLDLLIGISAACAIIAYGLYTLYGNVSHTLIYSVPLVIYGIARYLYLLYQRDQGEDPTSTVIKDWHIVITVITWLLLVILL